MKIYPISDLHDNSIITLPYSIDVADVVVIAGDLTVHENIIRILGELREYTIPIEKPIIYITGNHEYYGSSKQATDALMK